MSDDREDMVTVVPVVAVNNAPSVLSDLLEADDALANEIVYLVGGIENYRNFKHVTRREFSLSMEDQDQQGLLSKLLDALIRFLLRMADDIMNGSVNISLNLNRLINRAELINTESRATRRLNKDSKFKIETRIQNLCVNYKPINDPQRLLMFLKTIDVVVRKYFKFQDEELVKIIPSILTLKPTDPTSIDRLVALLSNVSPVSFANLAGFGEGEYRRVGPHLLGNQQLIVLNKNPHGDLIEQLTGQEFLLQQSDSEPKSPPDFIEYEVFARSIEQSLLRQVIATATDLAGRIGTMARMRRGGRINDLIKYLDVIRKDIAVNKYEGDELKNALAFVTLLEAFDNWLVNPYLSLLALMCRNMSAVLNVCDGNN